MKKDKVLLKKCLLNWQHNLMLALSENIREIRCGNDHCPFCLEYLEDGTCYDCPIGHKTGKEFCRGTPYPAVARNLDKLRFCDPLYWVERSRDKKRLIKNICREIRFLESLKV